MDTSHVFSGQDLLATVTLRESVASVGGAKSCSGYEVGLLCPASPAALPGVWVNSQAAGIETLRVKLRWDLFPLSVPLLPTLGLWSKGGELRTQ